MSAGRRRRILRDDAPGNSNTRARRTKSSRERYTDQAKHEHLPRMIDAVPKRGVWVTTAFMLGLLVLAALYFADFYRQRYSSRLGGVHTSAFALSGYATLANWWSSVCLLICSFLTAVIYSVRAHRVDDYRGRYRQWAVFSGLCLVASACLAAPVHQTLESVATQLAGNRLAERPMLWWMIPTSLIASVVWLRAFLDMRPCRSGPFFLLLAGAAYIASALGHVGAIRIDAVSTQQWLPATFCVGHYCLLWSLSLFARYVYLDAQGEIQAKSKPRRDRKIAELEDESEQRESAPKAKKRAKAAAPLEEETAEDEDMSLAEMELLTNPDLTRAEKRKLRKQLKRDRRAA